MSVNRSKFVALIALCAALSMPQRAGAALLPSADAQTVHDTTLHVTWLANANLAASQSFGIAGVNANGTMTYSIALAWVRALNAAGYLGHHNWQLPTTPDEDRTCAHTGRHGESFGFGCTRSALASLYYGSLHEHAPHTAVPMPATTAGPFRNVQPYLYWSASPARDAKQGFVSFSFDTGFQGANVRPNDLYVWPAIKGTVSGTLPGTVYDQVTNTTWLADANLAGHDTFGVADIDADGAMPHDVAVRFVNAMNRADAGRGYLGRTDWTLPETVPSDSGCSIGDRSGFGCSASPLGELFYGRLRLHAGDSAVPTPDVRVGPFHNVQPYLYWACAGEAASAPCDAAGPAPNFEWNFSFGNGFQGTNLDANELFVMIYYPDER